jgi:hypothetical protein
MSAPARARLESLAMEGIRHRRLALAAVLALACAGVVTATLLVGTAEAKEHRKSMAGTYRGTTEEGGTVTFRLTRKAKIVGFRLTNATLYCGTQPGTFDEYTMRTIRITHAPMPMQKVSKKNPQGKKFEVSDPLPYDRAYQGGLFTGHVEDLTSTPDGGAVVGRGMQGEVNYGTANGPTPPGALWAPGTESCATKYIDWDATRPGTHGFFPPKVPPTRSISLNRHFPCKAAVGNTPAKR